MTRRQLLATGCAACAGATGLLMAGSSARAAQAERKTRIRIIYSLHAAKQAQPDWPNVGFDFEPVMTRITTAIKAGCPQFEVLGSMANGPEAAAKILEQDKAQPVDGYIVYQMNCWNRVVQTVVESGKPTLYADFQYGGSGGFLVYMGSFLRGKLANVGFVASSRMEDVVAAARCFEIVAKGGKVEDFVTAVTRVRTEGTPKPGNLTGKPDKLVALTPEEWRKKMKESKILAVEGGWPAIAPAIEKEMGVKVASMPFAELNAAWEAADKDESRAIADRWQKTAKSIADVSRETLEQSAAMYLACKAMLTKHEANAITINCLGGFYGKHLQAYPCLGFHELNNEGLIGACECDIRSTATMVAMTGLTQGRPGLISDPVIDTSKNQIIYAHCVSHNRPFGPKGETNPFDIMTHSEDRQGASVRSHLPAGYLTTTVEFAPEIKEILFHQAKAVACVDDDRACRTKLAAEPVGDMEKLFTEWDRWGWHRVTYYGDLKEPVVALADSLGWKLIEEA